MSDILSAGRYVPAAGNRLHTYFRATFCSMSRISRMAKLCPLKTAFYTLFKWRLNRFKARGDEITL
nr:MAG TPA: hypothetical protein [Caudoviricetes sp.]